MAMRHPPSDLESSVGVNVNRLHFMVWLETCLINSQGTLSDVGSSLKDKHFSNVFAAEEKGRLFTCEPMVAFQTLALFSLAL